MVTARQATVIATRRARAIMKWMMKRDDVRGADSARAESARSENSADQEAES
jgi:hypothetical protein